ncbi:MAG: hypothetical protein ACW964_05490 [Candidatus Hodarchaeales archaeon]|jgi:N-acetylglutamate synthase-like GNAT family acetyltransferase
MSNFKIVKYQEGFEEEHAHIGVKIAKSWVYPYQATAEEIRSNFANKLFDHDSSLYCFSESKMVGVMISQLLDAKDNVKRAKITFPLALPRKEEVIDLLYDRAIEELKKKDIKVVFASFGSIWPNSEVWIKKWGFSNKKDERAIYRLDVILNEVNDDLSIARSFNPETDLDHCVKMWVDDFNLPEEKVRNFLLSINSNKETISHLVLKKEEKIVAQGAVELNSIDPTKGLLCAIHAAETSYLNTILKQLSVKSKKNGIKNLYIFFTHLDIDSPKIKPYKELGFTYAGSQAIYEKII